MSRQGMQAALEYGRNLPSFSDQKTAESELFRQRDKIIREIIDAAGYSDLFAADFRPESLKSLEKWYFILWESDSFDQIGMTREQFERCISMYFGEVIVRNSSEFEWFVDEYAFIPGRYVLGVRKEMVSLTLTRETDLYARRDNKRKQSIWREYRRWTKR